MDALDPYATLGVDRAATDEQIKRAYRKLAKKYHPDVSKERDAEKHFKDVSEAYRTVSTAEKRTQYEEQEAQKRYAREYAVPPQRRSGPNRDDEARQPDESFDADEFMQELLRAQHGHARHARRPTQFAGADQHATLQIDLEDSYLGARRALSLRISELDGEGQMTMQERQLEVTLPKGVRSGQHLRLAGQGGPGFGGGPAGDLYVEIEIRDHPPYRVEGRDVYLTLPVAPWEAALGATVTLALPDSSIELSIPKDSSPGRELRLKGRGLPSRPPGDLYVVLSLVLPPADTPQAKAAYVAMEKAFSSFEARPA